MYKDSNVKQSESIFDATQKLDSLARQLNRLANSFYDVGNETVAGNLMDIAYSLKVESEAIRRIDKDNLNQQLNESKQLVGKVMSLALKLRENSKV